MDDNLGAYFCLKCAGRQIRAKGNSPGKNYPMMAEKGEIA